MYTDPFSGPHDQNIHYIIRIMPTVHVFLFFKVVWHQLNYPIVREGTLENMCWNNRLINMYQRTQPRQSTRNFIEYTSMYSDSGFPFYRLFCFVHLFIITFRITCRIIKITGRVRESMSLTQGLLEHLLKTTTSRDHHAILHIMRRKSFLSASRMKVELIKRTGRLFAQFKYVKQQLDYQLRFPDRYPTLTPAHRWFDCQ